MEYNLKKEEPFIQCIPHSSYPKRKQIQHETHNSPQSSSKVRKPCSHNSTSVDGYNGLVLIKKK